METKKVRKNNDELIAYLLNSKREEQRKSREFAKTPEFKEILIKLRSKN
jgi:hypothetical protein